MKIKASFRTGISFGAVSGIVTPLGIMVGLNAGTHSELAVIGGLLTVAVADGIADSFGIHVSEEADPQNSKKEVWESTIATLIAKFLVVMPFVVPIILFPLTVAIIVNIVWGLLFLGVLSMLVAYRARVHPLVFVGKHLAIAIFTIVATHFTGSFVASRFQ